MDQHNHVPTRSWTAEAQQCRACGLTDPNISENLYTPFSQQPFDSSPEAIQEALRIIERGEGQIRLVEEAIERLLALKEQKRRVVVEHRNLLAPINRLPDEVLVLICEELCSEKRADREEDYSYYREDASPWEMTVVCRRWRNLAVSLAYLWTDIILVFRTASSSGASLRRQCKNWELQLARSGSSPLELRVDLSVASVSSPWPQNVTHVCQQVLAKSDQCRSLSLNGWVPEGWGLDGFTFPSFHSLQALHIMHRSWIKFLEKSLPLNAPSLEDLTVHSVRYMKPSFLSTWSTLRTLRFYSCEFTAAGFLEVLHLTSQGLETLGMEDLTVVVPTPPDSLGSFIPSLHFPQLRRFELAIDISDYTELLLRLRTPKLTEFKLQYPQEREVTFTRQFFRPLNADSPLLKHLQLVMPLICDDLFVLLSELKELDQLILGIGEDQDSPRVFEALRWHGPGETTTATEGPGPERNTGVRRLCPKLTRFEVKFNGGASYNVPESAATLLQSFVRSRARKSANDVPRTVPPYFLEFVRVVGAVDVRFLWAMQRQGRIRTQSTSLWPWD